MKSLHEFGFVGLGRMGFNMVTRAQSQTNNLRIVVWNRDPKKMNPIVQAGGVDATDWKDMITKLSNTPRVIWLMLPSGEVTENAFRFFLDNLDKGDVIIDGSNSNFHHTKKRHFEAERAGLKMLDVGVSGGIIAKDSGYPMMVGGDLETYHYCEPIFKAIGIEGGVDLVGTGGAGHYVKMIHNSIEYGMMQAIAEGFDLLNSGSMKDLDLLKIAKIWNHGTIVSSFLMKMVESALTKDEKLKYLKPYVDDSGEGRWGAIEALECNVPFTVNSYALNARYASRDSDSFAMKSVAAMRNEFGGHAIKK